MAEKMQQMGSRGIIGYTSAFVGVTIIVVLVIIAGFQAAMPPFWIWLCLLGLFIVLTLILSKAISNRWLGILIDERNKYSLSRLQMMLWTVMVISAFTAAVLANVQLDLLVYVSVGSDPPLLFLAPSGSTVATALLYAEVIYPLDEPGLFTTIPDADISQLSLEEPLKDGQQIYVALTNSKQPAQVETSVGEQNLIPTTPLSVQIPSEVWLLLGISATSLVASPLIKGQKPRDVVKNQSASEAKLSDLFKGEESSNQNLLDLSKVQLFYFTLIVIGAYMIALANLFLHTQYAIASLPALDGGVIAMLGVSHAGYLTTKAINHGDNANPTTASAPPAPPTEGDSSDVG